MIKTLTLAISLCLALFGSAALAEGASAAAAPLRLVVLGDSLSAGYNLGPGEGFTDQLQKALVAKGHDVAVVNAGVSGDTAAAGLARLDWSVGPDAQAVIVELGANDMLRGFDPDQPRQALDAILTRLGERKLPVLLAGMRAAPNLGPDYAKRFDALYPDLAASHGAMLYPFFLDGVVADQELLLADGMHPNAAGVAVIVEKILPAVEELVAQAKR
ncbi:arylesterase [Kaistia sp. 32K]|uniref:arylesterase n=1 Tax=Kaistia sp. 32K TaxID=2795690 RepID=UPI0019374081|nr:arylesterase [Kaistia sp. 32K]BCP55666.1 arylesterase [Kaistia sp. 32K]